MPGVTILEHIATVQVNSTLSFVDYFRARETYLGRTESSNLSIADWNILLACMNVYHVCLKRILGLRVMCREHCFHDLNRCSKMNAGQGMIDAAGFCCYGVVDAFGVCNGWDASGQIALSLIGAPASAASAAAVAGYLGIDPSRLHPTSQASACAHNSAALAPLICIQFYNRPAKPRLEAIGHICRQSAATTGGPAFCLLCRDVPIHHQCKYQCNHATLACICTTSARYPIKSWKTAVL